MTKTTTFVLAALSSGLIALPAFAQTDQWRTQVQVTVGSGTGTQFAFDGGLNVASSSQTLSSGNTISEASSALNSSGFIPTLRARAFADSIDAQAVAWGVQAYTNTSGSPVVTALVLQLDATITGSNDVEGRVYLFEEANFEFFQDPGTMLFESSSQLWPGFETFANNLGPTGFDVVVKNTPGSVSETRQFDFTVAAGDSFYVWARLVATADQPGEVDASSTLTASLTNTTGLTPAGTTAPGPASGRVPSSGGSPLIVELAPNGDVILSWGASCAAADDDYGVYEGSLGQFLSHAPITCTTTGLTTVTFAPATGDSYYLVVPNNPSHEGSYGLGSPGVERPPSASACRLQLVDVCE